MTYKLNRTEVADRAVIHAEAAFHQPTGTDRSFELPTALYVITACGYLAFLGIMALGFGNPGLILPMAIFVTFIAMAFGVPAQWVRMKPHNLQRALGWERFKREGIMTGSGRFSARDATIQVLLMPAMILAWGVIVVTIAAISR